MCKLYLLSNLVILFVIVVFFVLEIIRASQVSCEVCKGLTGLLCSPAGGPLEVWWIPCQLAIRVRKLQLVYPVECVTMLTAFSKGEWEIPNISYKYMNFPLLIATVTTGP